MDYEIIRGSCHHLFGDRHQAGELLTQKLKVMNLGGDICVLALPRGGVPVAWEISQALKCPLDLLFVKKIGAPGHPEFAIGAISEDGETLWHREAIDELKIPSTTLQKLAAETHSGLKAQIEKWRHGRPSVEVKDKTAIIVDDGLATGATMVAAIQFLKKKKPKQIVVAVPVATDSAKKTVSLLCDHALILKTPSPFLAVGQWYRDFTQVTDAEVQNLMASQSVLDQVFKPK